MTGRPSDLTQAIADAICERLAGGESLKSVYLAEDMPHWATVFRWLGAHNNFRDMYLCMPGNLAHHDRILFRDYLCSHLETAKSYAALKRRLAEEANGDWDYYTGGKTDFIAHILRRALVELDSLPKVTDQRLG